MIWESTKNVQLDLRRRDEDYREYDLTILIIITVAIRLERSLFKEIMRKFLHKPCVLEERPWRLGIEQVQSSRRALGGCGDDHGDKGAWNRRRSEEPGGMIPRPPRVKQPEMVHTGGRGGCLWGTKMPAVPFKSAIVAAIDTSTLYPPEIFRKVHLISKCLMWVDIWGRNPEKDLISI